MDKPRIQAHGLTEAQMTDLQYKQIHGEVEYVPANNAENIKDPHFKDFEKHQIPEHEQHIYHVVTESRLFNQTSGEKISEPVVKTFTKEAFKFHDKHNGFAGQAVHILHNPELNDSSKKKENEDDELGDLKVAELRDKYHELSGKDAPNGLKKADLIELINNL